MFTIYEEIPKKSGWKVNGTYRARLPTAVRDMSLPLSVFYGTCVRFLMLFQWKISGSNGTSDKVVLFSGRKVPSGNFDTIFRLSRPLTDLCTKDGKHCQFSHVNGKQSLTADRSLKLQVESTCNIVATCLMKKTTIL